MTHIKSEGKLKTVTTGRFTYLTQLPWVRALKRGYRKKYVIDYDPWDIKQMWKSKESDHRKVHSYIGSEPFKFFVDSKV